MLNGKQTDISNWKNKLDALDTFQAADSFDKNAVWDRLHHRLHEKPPRKKAGWYLAAACLLSTILFSWIITLTKKENTPAKNNTQQSIIVKEKKTVPEQDPAIMHAPAPFIIEKNSTSAKKAFVRLKNNKPVRYFAPDKQKMTNTTNEPSAVPFPHVVPPPDSAGSIMVVATVKKKLRVIHINELDKNLPAGKEQMASGHRETRNIKLKFGSSTLYNTPDTEPPGYSTLLKIPLNN